MKCKYAHAVARYVYSLWNTNFLVPYQVDMAELECVDIVAR